MNILLLELDANDIPDVANEVRERCAAGHFERATSPHAALAVLAAGATHFDLLVLSGCDGETLLSAYSGIAANIVPPPTLALSACPSVEAAVGLLRTGVDDLLVVDGEGLWKTQLADAVSALVNRSRDLHRRQRIDAELRESQRYLSQIVDGCSVAMFVIDEQQRVTHWNEACEVLTGIAAADMVGTCDHWRAFYDHPRPCLANILLDSDVDARVAEYYGDKRYRRSSTLAGTYEAEDFFPAFGENGRWLYFTAAPLRDSNGRTIGAIETLIDITERKLAEAQRIDSERRLAQIVDGSAVAMFVIGHDHRITHWNRACAALTGLPAQQLVGTNEHWRAFYPDARPCMADLVLDGALEDRVAQYYGNKKYHRSAVVEGGFEAEDFFPSFGSSGRWLYFTAAPLKGADGRIIGAIETLQDITEQKRAEEQLRQSEERYRVLSITDGMTGLYNARHFSQRLREEMDRAQRYRHALSLMVLDVDNFKRFNDTWGHVHGDQVLIQLAECIAACLRRTDQGFRYGGEEFVVLLPETDLDEAEAAAERVRTMFAGQEFFPAAAQRVECTASIGVTSYIPGESPRDFVARADSGTYEAKRQGKNRVIRILPPPPPR